jgi:hypothetical protein
MPMPTPEARQRTRVFARVLGPFVAVATVIIAIRLSQLGDLLSDLFTSGTLPWILGAAMLMMGLIVIAFHQYWYSVTAVLISLFGWFVALRGATMMALPVSDPDRRRHHAGQSRPVARGEDLLLLLTAMGLWFTYVGWRREATQP